MAEEDGDSTYAAPGGHIPPEPRASSFHCPKCNVLAHQQWSLIAQSLFGGYQTIDEAWVAYCSHCHGFSYWIADRLVHPRIQGGPLPHPDMPEDVRQDYEEARSIVSISPRGACGLLRLGLQKLMPHLGHKGKDINTDIGNLVKQGLPVEVQQALDALRVVGNNALHPGQMDLRDDRATAEALFGWLNFIVEQRIAQPKRLEELYGRLPQDARDAIDKRDASTD
jgi:hypothetical protein